MLKWKTVQDILGTWKPLLTKLSLAFMLGLTELQENLARWLLTVNKLSKTVILAGLLLCNWVKRGLRPLFFFSVLHLIKIPMTQILASATKCILALVTIIFVHMLPDVVGTTDAIESMPILIIGEFTLYFACVWLIWNELGIIRDEVRRMRA